MVATQTALSTGRYELAERVGSGGMGEVYRARDQVLGRDVAVKLPALHDSPAARERFRREATSAARLDHPNIVRVYDWDEADGTAFIVMEYVEGSDLHQLLHARRKLPVAEAAAIGVQVADALAHAHARGVVHRDIKPANVLLTGDGTVKVTDFGIARTAGTDTLTEPGAVVGTAGYVSPEQLRRVPVDGRSDVYALGMLLSTLTGGARGALAPVIARATAPEPDARYQSAQDMRTALAAVAAGEHVSTARLVPLPPPRAPDRPAAPVPPTRLAKPRPRRPRRSRVWKLRHVVLVALPLLLVLGGGAAAYVVLTSAPPQVVVPEVVNTDATAASASLRQAKLAVDVRYVDDPNVGGTVLAQRPVSGRRVDEGSTVVLTVSRTRAVVPDVGGRALDAARTELAARGFATVDVSYQDTEDEDPGTVLGSTPAPGIRADKRAPLTLLVARDPYVDVPPVVSTSEASADAALQGLGLVPARSVRSSRTVPAGTVMSVNPRAGQSIRRGSTVTLEVSSGPRQLTVASVVTWSRDAAVEQLEHDGFLVAIQVAPVTSSAQDGRVVAQSPNGGTAAEGSTVTITLGQRTARSGHDS
jgi:serine/threonine-protein kinase